MLLIINEQHSLFPEQEEILNKKGGFETIEVPADGWTLEEQQELVGNWYKTKGGEYENVKICFRWCF